MDEADPRPAEDADATEDHRKLVEHIVDSLKQGQKIQAIKDYREATGCGLKESKEVIDELIAKYEIPMKSGCASMVLIALSTAALLVAAFLV